MVVIFPKIKLSCWALLFLLPAVQCSGSASKMNNSNPMLQNVDVVKVSERFLYQVKVGEEAAAYFDTLRQLDESYFLNQIEEMNRRKAFWINIYNAVAQYHLKKDAEQYSNRSKFYKKELVNIAGHNLSLDDVEHGMLRRSKSKWSKGYFNTLFKSQFEKQARMDAVDYRIHFALNCGASSCPPIAFYSADKLDKQLDQATKVYLNGESEIKNGTVYVPKLMTWFKADFGGNKGIRKILVKWGVITQAQSEELKIEYKPYNWDMQLDYYK